MSHVPRPAPRFVPTLTEVVDPATLGRLIPKTQVDEVQTVVDLVLRQMEPVFERRLEEEFNQLVRATVASQWADLRARLQDEMVMFVQQAVADALAERSRHQGPK